MAYYLLSPKKFAPILFTITSELIYVIFPFINTNLIDF